MKKKELKDLEFIANGVLIENESIERMESDRRKRLLAASFGFAAAVHINTTLQIYY